MLFCFALSDYHHSIPIIYATCGTSSSAQLGQEVCTTVMIAVLVGVRNKLAVLSRYQLEDFKLKS